MKKIAVAVLTMAAAAAAFSLPDTSRRRTSPREWKDEHGNVIKRLDPDGRVTLFWWDDQHRVVKIAGLAHRFTPEQAKGTLDGGDAWVHCFLYAEEGDQPIEEIDCVGERRPITDGEHRKPDLQRGTTLARHRHVSEAGHLGPFKPKPAGRVVVFEYDQDGRVKRRTESEEK